MSPRSKVKIRDQVIRNAAMGIDDMAEAKEAQFWPEDMLAAAATCCLMADAALKQWRDGKFEECLVTAHAAQQAEARLAKILVG